MKTLFYVSCTEIGRCAIKIMTDAEAKKPIIATLYNSTYPKGIPYNDDYAVALLTWHDLDMDNVNEKTFNKFVDDMQPTLSAKNKLDMVEQKQTMFESPKEAKILEYATQKHKGAYRYNGENYITHPLAVAEYLYAHGFGKEYILTALCHDLLEDTDATEAEILELAGPYVLEAVKLLTKKTSHYASNKPYDDTFNYLRMIKENDMALKVKIADRIHNLKCAVDAPPDFIVKYLIETDTYYLDFAHGSAFYDDMLAAFKALVTHLQSLEQDCDWIVLIEGAADYLRR